MGIRAAGFVTAASLSAVLRCGAAMEPPREHQESFVSRAVFADDHLWLLSDAGELSSIERVADSRRQIELPEPAYDLCLYAGKPAIVTCKRDNCEEWTVRSWDGDAWRTESTARAAKGEAAVGLACNDGIELVTTDRLIEFIGPGRGALQLSDSLPYGAVGSTYSTPNSLFVGINAGEWGGGLRQIDRKTGRVAEVASIDQTKGICGGPLNPSCDPVNAIVASPWKPGCIVAAIGLVHFVPNGRIVEVCDGNVREVYASVYKSGWEGANRQDSGTEPLATVAFFGLVGKAGVLWAAGINGIYRIGEDGTAKVSPMPEFKDADGIGVSFAVPEFALVATSINRRHSVSGNVPLLVPR